MTDITTYPLEDWFETTLSQDRDGAVGTIYVNTTPSFTFPAGVTTYIIVDPGKSNMQLAEISAYNSTLNTITVSSISTNKGASVAYTQQAHRIGAVVRISHNYQFWKDIVDSLNSKIDTNNDDIAMGKFADTTARDAYFTAPVEGNSAYITGVGRYDYTSWSWVLRAANTWAASVLLTGDQTVAGVKTFTDKTKAWWIEISSTTLTWTTIPKIWYKTGAADWSLYIQLWSATWEFSIIDYNWNNELFGVSWSWIVRTKDDLVVGWDSIKLSTTLDVYATASDAEAITGTATNRVITAKQAKDNYANTSSYVTGVRWTTWTWVTIAHWLWKIPSIITVMFKDTTTGTVWQGTCSTASLNQSCTYQASSVWVDLISWKFIDPATLNATVTAVDATNITVTRAWAGTVVYYIYSIA